jgi:hypothetical protein
VTIVAIIVAVLLAFLAFRFIRGMIKIAVLGVVVLLVLFAAHFGGAF